jgi:hypothetical protein
LIAKNKEQTSHGKALSSAQEKIQKEKRRRNMKKQYGII